MTGRLKLTAQVVALALVAGLLALLVWSVVHQEHAPGVGAPAPAFTRRHVPGRCAVESPRTVAFRFGPLAAKCQLASAEVAMPMRLILTPRGGTVAWTADLDGDGAPEWILESPKVRAVFSAQDGGRWIGLFNVVGSVTLGYIAVWIGAALVSRH